MSHELLDDLEYWEEKNKTQQIYAGFWIRVAATFIDSIVIQFILVVLAAVLGFLSYLLPVDIVDLLRGVLLSGVAFSYYPLFEASRYQATIGKQILSLKVVDQDGQKLSLGRAMLRFLAKFFSYFLLGLGFIMIAFNKKKQGLHDLMLGTYVIEKETSSYRAS